MLRPATDADSADVLRWRNHPEVRAVSLTQHEITEEEHAAYWAATRASDAREIYIYVRHGVAVRGRDLLRHRPGGRQRVVGLLPRQRRARRSAESCCRPGSRSSARPSGWRSTSSASTTLEGEVLEANEAVRRFNRRNGFEEIERYTHDIDGVATPVLRVRATKD